VILNYPIYCNLKPKIKKSIHTISGILANLENHGLVKESLGILLNLTRACIYHYVASGLNWLNLQSISTLPV